MRLKRLFFFVLIWCALFSPHQLLSQSSIYHDSKELADFLENTPIPTFDFSKMNLFKMEKPTSFENFSRSRAIAKEEKKVQHQESVSFYYSGNSGNRVTFTEDNPALYAPYTFPSFGYYSLNIFKNDTLTFSVLDTSLVIVGSDSPQFLTVSFTPDETSIYLRKKINEFDWGKDELIFFQKGKFRKMLKILEAHAGYSHHETSDYHEFKNTYSKYLTNPFFSDLTINQALLDSKAETFYDYYYGNEEEINHRKNYSWEKLLYGDSTLELQKKVSFQDVVSSYRTPIVTSKNELDEANIRINEKNKKRGALNAQTVAVGLSDFIAERAQEELNLTFFSRFRENLKDSSELTILFPNTKSLLEQFEISDYKTLLANARGSFTTDLENLGLHFPKVLELEDYRDLNNSSQVFNLALIYYIANLAYTDVPVEDILVLTYQKLKRREEELTKSINLNIASASLQTAVDTNGVVTFVPNGEVDLLKSSVENYLDVLVNWEKEIIDIGILLAQETSIINDSLQQLNSRLLEYNNKNNIQESKTEIAITQFQRDVFEMENSIYREIDDDLVSGFGVQKFLFNGKEVYDEFKKYYSNTIIPNLKGKEYFGYYLDNPSMQEYENIFHGWQSNSEQKLFARGLAGSHNLLNSSVDELLYEKIDQLKILAKEVRQAKSKLLHFQKDNKTKESQIRDFIKKTKFLKLAIDEEILFWTKISAEGENAHGIAALQYLRAILDNDEFVNFFTTIETYMTREGMALNDILENEYLSNFGENFQINMTFANERLDTIYTNLTSKLNYLTHFSSVKTIDPSLYHQKINSSETNKKNLEIDHEISIVESKYAALLNKMETEFEKKLLSDKQIKPLYDELVELSDLYNSNPTSYDTNNTIGQRMDSLNTLIEPLIEKYYVDIEAEMLPIEEDYNNNIEALNSQKNRMFASSVMSDSAQTSQVNLSEIYDVFDNKNINAYLNEVEKSNNIDSSQFNMLDQLDRRIDNTYYGSYEIETSNAHLFSQLDTLEKKYCKNLVDAKENARYLSKSLELTIHLLFAFRDYEKVEKSITYPDSTLITVTDNQFDPVTKNLIRTSTLDTIHFENKPIDEKHIDKKVARWISRDDFDKLRRNEKQWNIFLGLLYQRMSTLEDAPNFTPDGIALLATKFLSIAQEMDSHRTNLLIKKATSSSNVNFKDFYPFIRSTVDLFNTIITTESITGKINPISFAEQHKTLKNIPSISNQALSLYENIYVQEYGNAILNAMELLKILAADKLTSDKKENKRTIRTINAVMLYGTFMSNMINAKTSDQVKNILKSATLPPGSSRIKRETRRSITINSYLGIGTGRDRLLGAPEMVKENSFGAALSVPIGITYSTSPDWIKNNSSISFHIPLLDLGAITAYRFNPDNNAYTIDNLPELEWGNLFSPGLFGIYNFANSPFSAGFGVQYGPQLRKIEIGTAEPVLVNSLRWPMVFFSVDVPFFQLHTGARKVLID